MRAPSLHLGFLPLSLLLPLLLSLSLCASPALGAVLAIDYGTDYMKASLMKPGIPFDVLLNKDSKRKIQSSVAWKGEERLFGSDAYNLATRFPKDSYNSLKYLLGVPANAEIVSYYKTFSDPTLVASSRFTVGIPKPGGRTWEIEELIAMQFAYVKSLAEDAAGERVNEVVVTVPPYYTQFERDAVADAVEIAGLRLLTLINDGTAVAVNYAMTRTFEVPERHVVFDVGASSTRATVVTFSTAKGKGKEVGGTSVVVNGVGWDRIVGGTEIDRRLRDVLIGEFAEKTGKDARKDAKAMARLWKEAGRVKAILSANTEAVAHVESLMDDVDFKTKVSRARLEAMCADMMPRWTQPILDALEMANLTMDDIKSVIMTGGAMRTPMVQAAIKATIGDDKIAMNVNADEAAVLGAALHGASLSRQFRTKDIRVQDIAPYDIQALYEAESSKVGSDGRPRVITTTIFPRGSKTDTRKTLTFKRKDDFQISFQYKDIPAPEFPVELLEASITGVKEAFANLTEMGGLDPVVKATILLSPSGFVSVPEAVAYADLKDGSLAGKLKGFFGSGETSTEAEGDGDEAATSTTSGSASKSTQAAKETSTSIPLGVDVRFTSVAPMALETKKEARQRLIAAEAAELVLAQREEQRNTLEGYLYRLRDLLEGDEDRPFVKCSTPEERRRIKEKMEEAMGWFQHNQDEAETAGFIEQRSGLEAMERPILHRYKEIEEFPSTLNNSQMWNWHTRMFLTEEKATLAAHEANGTTGRYTREELADLEKTLKDHERWLNEWVEKQKSVKMYEDPVIETKEMKERAKVLEMALQKLVRKPKPKPKATKKSSSSSSATPSGETTSSSSSAGAESTAGHDEL